ncbi:MAG: thymidine kinase [Phycisphaerales bacterium]|nr:thymidine kinase [Phycisphaerales bacterium]
MITSTTLHHEHAGRGKLTVIRGCMFAGKTAMLIERLRAAEAAGRRVVAVKHALDARYASDCLATHDSRRFPARAVDAPEALVPLADGVDVVGVDEAQFFGVGLVEVVERLRRCGCDVVVAGIDHDAWGQDFPPLPLLARVADEDVVRTVPCTRCGRPARFSERVTPVVGEDLVGGPGDYRPRCAACFQPLPAPGPTYEG